MPSLPPQRAQALGGMPSNSRPSTNSQLLPLQCAPALGGSALWSALPRHQCQALPALPRGRFFLLLRPLELGEVGVTGRHLLTHAPDHPG